MTFPKKKLYISQIKTYSRRTTRDKKRGPCSSTPRQRRHQETVDPPGSQNKQTNMVDRLGTSGRIKREKLEVPLTAVAK